MKMMYEIDVIVCRWCSVSTLLGYLKRFDANADIYLGERYGYQLLSPNGFNYITGGGGIVFSLSVIEKLVHICRCPSPHSPDDMIIALCLQRIGIEPIHSSRFHQVRLGSHFIFIDSIFTSMTMFSLSFSFVNVCFFFITMETDAGTTNWLPRGSIIVQ